MDSRPVISSIAAWTRITVNSEGVQRCKESITEMEQMRYELEGRENNPQCIAKIAFSDNSIDLAYEL